MPSGLTSSITPTKKRLEPWKFSSQESTVPHGVVAPLQLKAVPMMRLPSPSLLCGKTSVAAGTATAAVPATLRQVDSWSPRPRASGIGAASLDLRCYAQSMREWIVASCVYFMKLTHAGQNLHRTSQRPSGNLTPSMISGKRHPGLHA